LVQNIIANYILQSPPSVCPYLIQIFKNLLPRGFRSVTKYLRNKG